MHAQDIIINIIIIITKHMEIMIASNKCACMCVCVPESDCGSSLNVCTKSLAAQHSRWQHLWSFSAADERSLLSYLPSPAQHNHNIKYLPTINTKDPCVCVCAHLPTLKNGAFLAGAAARLKSSLRHMSSSRNTNSAGPSCTSSLTCAQQQSTLFYYIIYPFTFSWIVHEVIVMLW